MSAHPSPVWMRKQRTERTFHEGKEPVFGDPLAMTFAQTLVGFQHQLGLLGTEPGQSLTVVLERTVGAHEGPLLFLL